MNQTASSQSPETPSDAELLALSATGDSTAFEQFCQRHAPRIRGLFRRMGFEDSLADDLAQLSFVRAWKAAGRYRGELSAIPWLLTIAKRVALTESSKRLRHPAVSLDAESLAPDAAALHDPRQPLPSEAASHNELLTALREALAELPPQQAMALSLHLDDDLSHEEVARILETSIPSVKSLIFRARATLREKLKRFLAK